MGSLRMMLLVYDKNGMITHRQQGQINASMIAAYQSQGSQCLVLEQDVFDLLYVKDGALAQRPKMSVTQSKTDAAGDGNDIVEIVGIPDGAKITLRDANSSSDHAVTDGKAEISSKDIGQIAVTIECWPYQNWTGSINFK
jgi:hypothetical protein